MTVIGVFIDTYLRLSANEEQVFRSELATIQPIEQEGIMELMTSWEEKGWQRGRQEEGLMILRRQLTRRIGPLAPETEAHLQRLSLAEIEELSDALLDFSDPMDLMGWLQNHPA